METHSTEGISKDNYHCFPSIEQYGLSDTKNAAKLQKLFDNYLQPTRNSGESDNDLRARWGTKFEAAVN